DGNEQSCHKRFDGDSCWSIYDSGNYRLGAATPDQICRKLKSKTMELINLGIKSIFIENMIFAYFLGMCSFLAVSKKVSTAMGLGAAVVFVLGITVPLNWLVDEYILKAGALTWIDASFADIDLSFLQLIMFIAIIAASVQLVEMVV